MTIYVYASVDQKLILDTKPELVFILKKTKYSSIDPKRKISNLKYLVDLYIKKPLIEIMG